MDEFRIPKLGAFVPISQDMLTEVGDVAGLITDVMNRTPAERAAVEARQAARRAAQLAEAAARHSTVRAKIDGKLAAVLDLHCPADGSLWPECHGCEFGGYDAEPPEWPCETWVLVAEGLE